MLKKRCLIIAVAACAKSSEIIEWMFEHGVNKTINSYGFSEDEVKNIASSGTMKISKWTSSLNKILKMNPGHSEYFLN